eukprot:358478-Chlamydomonas_euryale.AAC.26
MSFLVQVLLLAARMACMRRTEMPLCALKVGSGNACGVAAHLRERLRRAGPWCGAPHSPTFRASCSCVTTSASLAHASTMQSAFSLTRCGVRVRGRMKGCGGEGGCFKEADAAFMDRVCRKGVWGRDSVGHL